MRTLAHVTHEAVHKVGGIGAVLEGLLTSQPYREADDRSILIGPWFPTPSGKSPLGESGEVLYSSFDGTRRHPSSDTLDQVCRDYHVGIVYGHRTYTDPHSGARVSPEVLLIGVDHRPLGQVNHFKHRLWDHFQIDSTRYENSWEYDLYIKLAEPAIGALRALGAVDGNNQCVILAHEFMGMPTALAAIMDGSDRFGTVFYAHEVSSIRRIVEHHQGHDVTFYNVLEAASREKRHMTEFFGDQYDYYRHALVSASRHCDRIFAVGHYVTRELRFLDAGFADANIVTTYNGIPSEKINPQQKEVSRERLRAYAEELLGHRPDYIFTRVTRTAVSKGIWRDLAVLEAMEPMLEDRDQTAVMFLLSTEVPARTPEDVRFMEQAWGWPVVHREVEPDLSHGEAGLHEGVQRLNARCRQIKVVFVNQFGWSREMCGDRMPQDMEFMDIRRGSDVEFGQSIYEPFGIAQLEPLTFGGVCLITGVCGCAGFVEKVTEGEPTRNVIAIDYHDYGDWHQDPKAMLKLTRAERENHELNVAKRAARQLFEALPEDDADRESLMHVGYDLAREMSWDVIARDHVLPEIDAICSKMRSIKIA